MKLLVLAHDLPPALSPRSIQVGRLLSQLTRQHDIYLATSTYHTKNRCDVYEDVVAQCHDRVSVTAVWDHPLLPVGMRLAPFLFHIPDPNRWDMGNLGRKIFSTWPNVDFDAIITFACPFSSHLLGRQLKKFYKKPWIAHFSDPWADNPLAEYGSLSEKINKRMEIGVVEEADKIIFVSEETKDFYLRKYPHLKEKISVLEHCYDPNLYPDSPSIKKATDVLTFRFLGNLYGGRSVDSLLSAVAQVSAEAENTSVPWAMEFVLSYQRSLVPLVKQHRLEKQVKLLNSVQYRESLALMKSADVLINIDAPWPREFGDNLFFPSKLVDYIGSARPIFGLGSAGAARRIIQRYGGWVADSQEPNDIKKALQDIFMKWRQGDLQKFEPERDGRDHYAVEIKAAQFMRLLS